MSQLRTFFERLEERAPRKGETGVFSDWMVLGRMPIQGRALQVTETRVLGLRGNEHNECYEIPVEPAVFLVECRCVAYGGDGRIAALRARPTDVGVERGEHVSTLSVDMAQVAVLDIECLEGQIAANKASYEQWIEDTLFGANAGDGLIRILKWDDTDFLCPSVRSGFGDGTYPVFALKSGPDTVGTRDCLHSSGHEVPLGLIRRRGEAHPYRQLAEGAVDLAATIPTGI